MKLIKLPTKPSGTEIWEFHLGRDELRVLAGMLELAVKHTPKTIETESVRNRLRTMFMNVQKALNPAT